MTVLWRVPAVVSLQFFMAMECLVLIACSLLVPTAVTSFVRWMARERTFPLWEKIESAFSLIEVLGFGFLFGVGVLCLALFRFQQAREFFSVGAGLFAIRMVAVSYKNLHGASKWIAVPIICSVMGWGTSYLLGIVDDAQAERATEIARIDQEKWDYTRNMHRPANVKIAPPPPVVITIRPEDLTDPGVLAQKGLITAKQMDYILTDWDVSLPSEIPPVPKQIKDAHLRQLAKKYHPQLLPLMKLANTLSPAIAKQLPSSQLVRKKGGHFAVFFKKAAEGYICDFGQAYEAYDYLLGISSELDGMAKAVSNRQK
jgi:hypothetical protein